MTHSDCGNTLWKDAQSAAKLLESIPEDLNAHAESVIESQ